MTAFDTFIAAETEFEARRRAWNALPTREARLASGIDLTSADDAKGEAAKALLVEAGDRHKIEEQARVWLVMQGGRWVIDMPDHCGFEGYDDGPVQGCEHDASLIDECRAVMRAAQAIELPGPEGLHALLTEYLSS